MDRRAEGDQAETSAASYLIGQGYRICARNFRCRFGELDIVAEKDGVLCFVEVRMRSSGVLCDPSETISFAKQRRLVKAALHYLNAHRLADKMLRFDVISVIGKGSLAKVDHIPNAFDAGM